MDESSKFHTVRGYQRLEQQGNPLTSAMEDYLEMIFRHSRKDGYIRINTLSELLNVAAPSATKMVQNLSRLGYVDYKKYEFIALTDKGKELGRYLLWRHSMIETFLRNLGLREELLTDTELVEHDLSGASIRKMSLFNSFLEQNQDIMKRYEEFAQSDTESG
ncbi:Transcriptional regulator MntR [bioreactor metagenome]|uniref:Transcriptional regulator MntR n=1 Tax=bioreactor metagenome TaxID=1076179 RepID=A0A645AKK9_9ZZZZ